MYFLQQLLDEKKIFEFHNGINNIKEKKYEFIENKYYTREMMEPPINPIFPKEVQMEMSELKQKINIIQERLSQKLLS